MTAVATKPKARPRRPILAFEGERWVTLDSGAKVKIDGEGTIVAGFGKGENIRAMGKREAKNNKGPAARKAAAKKANRASVAAAKKKAKAKGDSGGGPTKQKPDETGPGRKKAKSKADAKKARTKKKQSQPDTGAKAKAAKAAASLTDDDFGDLMSDLEYDTDLTSKGVTADNEAQLKRQFRDQMTDIASDYTDSDDDATNKQFADQAADALMEKTRQKYGGQGAKKPKLSADARDEADGWFEDAADPDMQANFDSLRKGDDKAVRDQVRAHMTDMGLEGGDVDAAADHVVSNLKSKLKSGEADKHYPASGPAKKQAKSKVDTEKTRSIQGSVQQLDMFHEDVGLEGADLDDAINMSKEEFYEQNRDFAENVYGQSPTGEGAVYDNPEQFKKDVDSVLDSAWSQHQKGAQKAAKAKSVGDATKKAGQTHSGGVTGAGVKPDTVQDNIARFEKAKTKKPKSKAAIDNTARGIAKGVASDIDGADGKELAAMSFNEFKTEMEGPELWGEFDDGLEKDLGRSLTDGEREQAKEAIVKATYDEIQKKHGKQQAKPKATATKKTATKKPSKTASRKQSADMADDEFNSYIDTKRSKGSRATGDRAQDVQNAATDAAREQAAANKRTIAKAYAESGEQGVRDHFRSVARSDAYFYHSPERGDIDQYSSQVADQATKQFMAKHGKELKAAKQTPPKKAAKPGSRKAKAAIDSTAKSVASGFVDDIAHDASYGKKLAGMSYDDFRKEAGGVQLWGEYDDGLGEDLGRPLTGGEATQAQDAIVKATYDAVQRKYAGRRSGESHTRLHARVITALVVDRALLKDQLLRQRAGTVLEHCAAGRAFEITAAPFRAQGDEDPVDTEKKIIRDVKILGVESKNTARVIGLDRSDYGDAVDEPYGYTIEACRNAAPLYEGAKVFSNHTPFDFDDEGRRVVTHSERKNEDLVGWLSEVHVVETGDPETDGLYGNFNYLEKHPLTPRIIEAARRNPRVYALSHEAGFDEPKIINGRIYLTKITEVDSVALVSSPPGTTRGLFETVRIPSQENRSMPITLRQLVESLHPDNPERELLEEAIPDEEGLPNELTDTPIAEAGPGEASPEQQIRAGMLSAINVALDRADVKTLKGVLGALGISDSVSEVAADQLPGEPDEEEVVEEEIPDEDLEEEVVEEEAPDEDIEEEVVAEEEAEEQDEELVAEQEADEDEEEETGTVAESRQPSAKTVLECVRVLKTQSIEPTETLLLAMAALPNAKARKTFASELAESLAIESIPHAMRTPKSKATPKPKGKVAKTKTPDSDKKYAKHGSLAESIAAPPGNTMP